MGKYVLFLFVLIVSISLSGLTANFYSDDFILDTIDPEVTLLMPVGGEIYQIGETDSILWEAGDSNLTGTPIALYYSLNGGLDWNGISDALPNSGVYEWLPPAQSTAQAKVRVIATDAFGNQRSDESDSLFSILGICPLPPQNVRIQAINSTDIYISWDKVTTDIHGQPLEIDGYLVLYSPLPVYPESFTQLAATSDNWFLHEGAADFYQSLYYVVIAYTGDYGRPAAPGSRIQQAGKTQMQKRFPLKSNLTSGKEQRQ